MTVVASSTKPAEKHFLPLEEVLSSLYLGHTQSQPLKGWYVVGTNSEEVAVLRLKYMIAFGGDLIIVRPHVCQTDTKLFVLPQRVIHRLSHHNLPTQHL